MNGTESMKAPFGELIAYCGVNCEVCADYLNGACPSCRKTVWEEGDECMPVACCRKKGISYCGECGESFPCSDMKEFYAESESHAHAFELMRSVQNRSENINK